MINYKEIIEQLNTEKVKLLLEQLDIPYQEKEKYLLMPTVCHNDDIETASWKLYYYKNTHVFYCYTECLGQTIFQFLKHYYETRGIDYDWFRDIYEVILDCSNYDPFNNFVYKKYKSIANRYQKEEVVKLPTYPNRIINCFIKYYPVEWLNDRISKQAMDKFNIRFSTVQNKIIIPHYNVDNELVGIRGRALDKWEVENIGKYMPVQIEGKWYSHPLSLNLYGLNMTKDNIRDKGICFLFESEKSVLQFEDYEFPNCAAAVCGSQLNKHALKLLIKNCHPTEIVICFDKEEKEGEEKYFYKLYNLCKKYLEYANFSFIYDRENLLELKDSPTDKGERTFKKLLKRRVVVK